MGNSDSSNPIQFVDAEQTHIFNKCCVPALEKLDLENKEIKVLDFLEFNVNDPTKQLKKHKSAKSEADQIEDKNVLHFVSFEEIFKLNYGTLQVGGKGLRLAQVFCSLNGNGSFSVPTGACLTTAAYSEHLGQFKGLMKEIIANSGDRASKSAAEAKIKELYEKIDHVEFNPQLKPKIEEFLNSLPPNSTVAVRSSATIEDAADFSLAGLCSSFLHVPAKVEDVVKRIKECWKSMWQTTMTSFLVRSGKKKLPKMAVVVQQMIQSKASGVLFTLNPSNGNEEEFYLEAVHGLGEGLVSGEISPSCYTINWVTGQSTRTLEANQKKKYVCTGDGVKIVDNNDNSDPLTEFDLIREMGVTLARHYGHPQDVEWAIDDRGDLFMTQTRPITKIHCDIKGEWVSGFTFKSWLAMSLTSVAGYVLFMRIMNKLPKEKVRDENLVKIKYGLAYINSYEHSNTYHTHQESSHALSIYQVFADVTKRYTDHYRAKMEPLLWRLIASVDKVSDEQLANVLLAVWYDRSELTCHSFMTGFVARKYLNDIESEIATFNSTLKKAGSSDFIKMEKLVTQIHPGTGEALRDLRVLAGMIARDKSDMKLIVNSVPEKIISEIKNRPIFSEFENFFKKHFWFCDLDEDIQAVRWLDDPKFALTILQSELKKKLADENYSFSLNEQESFQGELKRVKEIFKNNKSISKQWSKFESDLLQFRNYLYWKEDVHITYGRQNYFVCKMINELGSRWHKKDLLEDGEDIYYLGAKEFEEIVTSGNLKQLRQAVFRNKTIRESLINFNIPTRLSNEDLYSQQNNKKKVDPNSKSLIGQGGSPGTVTGKARVITDLNDADLVQPGEILVTHHTSPGWTPLFSLIAGLVTEEGGILSHGAVVAREFKIPAVLRVKEATTVVKTGQTITINGGSGVVELS